MRHEFIPGRYGPEKTVVRARGAARRGAFSTPRARRGLIRLSDEPASTPAGVPGCRPQLRRKPQPFGSPSVERFRAENKGRTADLALILIKRVTQLQCAIAL